jgi:hypothetical protein
MNLVHVPIPISALEQTAHAWLPFVERVIKKTGDSLEQAISIIRSGEVALHLVWEPEAQKAHALVGVRIFIRTTGKVAEMLWMVGDNRKQWLPMLDEFEKYHKEHLGCVAMSAITRRGMLSELKPRGYRTTRFVVEKDL